MSLKEQAAAIRAATDADLIAAELAKWPAAETIGEREKFDAAYYLAKLPKDAAQRVPAAEKLAGDNRDAAKEDRARYEDLRTRALPALSDYDIVIAASGNGLVALRTALLLKHNHITYHNSIASAAEAEARAARDSIPQFELF